MASAPEGAFDNSPALPESVTKLNGYSVGWNELTRQKPRSGERMQPTPQGVGTKSSHTDSEVQVRGHC